MLHGRPGLVVEPFSAVLAVVSLGVASGAAFIDVSAAAAYAYEAQVPPVFPQLLCALLLSRHEGLYR